MNKNGKSFLTVGAIVLGVIIFLGESKMPPILCGVLLLGESILVACLLLLPVLRRSGTDEKAGRAESRERKRIGRKSVPSAEQKLYLRYILFGSDPHLLSDQRDVVVPFAAGKNISINFKDHDFVVHCEEKDGIRRFVIPAREEDGSTARVILENGRAVTIRDTRSDGYISLSAIAGM